MKSLAENKKLSLIECKNILNKDDVFYTDEEIIELRDWLYLMADIVLDASEKGKKNDKQQSNEKEDFNTRYLKAS